MMEFDPAKFAQWLKDVREKKGLSWYALADLCGLHQSALATIEQHGRDIRMSTFIRICNGLGQTPSTVIKKVVTDET